jgi:hypothetical protein
MPYSIPPDAYYVLPPSEPEGTSIYWTVVNDTQGCNNKITPYEAALVSPLTFQNNGGVQENGLYVETYYSFVPFKGDWFIVPVGEERKKEPRLAVTTEYEGDSSGGEEREIKLALDKDAREECNNPHLMQLGRFALGRTHVSPPSTQRFLDTPRDYSLCIMKRERDGRTIIKYKYTPWQEETSQELIRHEHMLPYSEKNLKRAVKAVGMKWKNRKSFRWLDIRRERVRRMAVDTKTGLIFGIYADTCTDMSTNSMLHQAEIEFAGALVRGKKASVPEQLIPDSIDSLGHELYEYLDSRGIQTDFTTQTKADWILGRE